MVHPHRLVLVSCDVLALRTPAKAVAYTVRKEVLLERRDRKLNSTFFNFDSF